MTCFCVSLDNECDRLELVAKTELLDPCRLSLLYILWFSLRLDPTDDEESKDVDSSADSWSLIIGASNRLLVVIGKDAIMEYGAGLGYDVGHKLRTAVISFSQSLFQLFFLPIKISYAT
jgi:hypothetical protein